MQTHKACSGFALHAPMPLVVLVQVSVVVLCALRAGVSARGATPASAVSSFARSVDAPLHGCGSMRPAQARAQSAGMLITLRCFLSHGRKRQPPHSWMRPHLPRLWCLATPADAALMCYGELLRLGILRRMCIGPAPWQQAVWQRAACTQGSCRRRELANTVAQLHTLYRWSASAEHGASPA